MEKLSLLYKTRVSRNGPSGWHQVIARAGFTFDFDTPNSFGFWANIVFEELSVVTLQYNACFSGLRIAIGALGGSGYRENIDLESGKRVIAKKWAIGQYL